MLLTDRKAFTMLELIFVIVIIGILATIAVPRLWVTRDDAIITKGRADVSTIRSALATDRQKRMLEGNSTIRQKLDNAANNTEDVALFTDLLEYGIYSKNRSGHWKKTGANTYVFITGDGTNVTFTYNTNNGTFDCDHTIQACRDLTQ